MSHTRHLWMVGLTMALSACAQPIASVPSGTEAPPPPEAVRLPATYGLLATPPTIHSSRITERAILALVNQERVKAGLAALVDSVPLRLVARAHSQDMIAKGYFAHNSPDGKTPSDRLTAARIGFSAWGENIRWVSPRTGIAKSMMYEPTTGWMNSPPHRANILNANFTKTGIGVWKDANGNIYATEVFIRP